MNQPTHSYWLILGVRGISMRDSKWRGRLQATPLWCFFYIYFNIFNLYLWNTMKLKWSEQRCYCCLHPSRLRTPCKSAELEWRWGGITAGLCALSARSSGEDKVDIVLRGVTQRGQGLGVGVKGMTAEQPVKPTLEFLHNLSHVISTVQRWEDLTPTGLKADC